MINIILLTPFQKFVKTGNERSIISAKIGIIIGSLVFGILGCVILRFVRKKNNV